MPTQLIDRYGNYYDADNPLPIGGSGQLVQATASFQRPADTTQYAIADAVANSTTAGSVSPLVFGGMANDIGGTGLITNLLFWKSTITVTAASFRLYLMTSRLATAFADNAAFNLLYADMARVVAVLDFTLRTEGASATVAYAFDDTRRVEYRCDGAETSLFGYLTAEAVYTPPSNSEQFFVRLTARRDA